MSVTRACASSDVFVNSLGKVIHNITLAANGYRVWEGEVHSSRDV